MAKRSEPVVRSITLATVGPQLGLAALLLAFGIDIVWGSMHRDGSFLSGGLFGVGVTAIALGLVFGWSARLTRQHVNEPASYWQAMQNRSRPRIIGALFVLGGCGAAAAITCYAVGGVWLAGATAALGGVALGLAVACVTGGIRPIKYE